MAETSALRPAISAISSMHSILTRVESMSMASILQSRRREICSKKAKSMPNSSQHRSEEHTSELQSLMRISYAVFCLKKKKQQQNHTQSNTTTTNTNYIHENASSKHLHTNM